jgi:hypothetical protein
MFKRLNETILKAIEQVFEEFEYNISEWWKDDFPTDYYYENKNDLKTFPEHKLGEVMSDWVQWSADKFVDATCKELGIDIYNITNKCHELLIEELFEIVKAQLWEKVLKDWN